MGSGKINLSSKASLPFKTANKHRRQLLYAKQKKARENAERDARMRRKRTEDADPRLREERRRKNVPQTLESKRVWDETDRDAGDGLGLSIDVQAMQTDDDVNGEHDESMEEEEDQEDHDDDRDSMIDPDSESEGEDEQSQSRKTARASSLPRSTTSTQLDLAPEALAARFPSLFPSDDDSAPTPIPKILVTTSLNSALHREAKLLTTLFPNSVYIPRSSHHYGHKYSVKEISRFAANRHYTAVIVLMEDQKRPCGLDIVHLPEGPMFHFTLTNWIEGKKLPGHGNPTEHYPELILNNFKTPLGILSARLFQTMFPPQPEFVGRQVVTLHNQRDYIFVRRHRYVFREKRGSEKEVIGTDGQPMKGVEGIRAGLQELGPRFTLKLRRIDKGIQRTSGQEWEWKGRMEKQRTKFQL